MPDNKRNDGKLVIGVDFGTDSCRALAVDIATGEELAVATSPYSRWKKGWYCNSTSSMYRQHPLDYIESLQEAIRELLTRLSPGLINNIVAIGCDATSSTVCITDVEGVPLSLSREFSEDPDAMFLLWKDHTAIEEAKEINSLSRNWKIDYTALSGASYSLEWFWAKILQLLRANRSIRQKAYSAIELCDWIPALLTGTLKPERVKRSRCAAGHKCMWAAEWGGYPSRDFFSRLDPQLGTIREHLRIETYTNGETVGKLTPEWAGKLGLSSDVVISTGIVDAHAAAIGAGVKPGTMVKIVGTSTCDIVVVPPEILGSKKIKGISGQVDGSVIPGLIGIEAGQAAFGDVYAWFRNLLTWPLEELSIDDQEKKRAMDNMLNALTEKAVQLPTTGSSLVSLDFLNGRRTPDPDPAKRGIISGITLGTTAPEVFKSLVEATAFGARAIYEHYVKEGLELVDIVSVGGIPQKSPFVMQVLSDVLGVPIKVASTGQAGALGAAMCAARAAGLFSSVEAAQQRLKSGISKTYLPDEKTHGIYTHLYQKYLGLGVTR